MGDDEDGNIIVYSSGPDMCLRAMHFTVDILRLILSYYQWTSPVLTLMSQRNLIL